MPRVASTVEILVDGSDVTSYVLPAESRFESVASALPGAGVLTLKDPGQDLSFTTGDVGECYVDGELLWAGILRNIGRRHFFPAADTTNLATVESRKWVLTFADYNTWFDARVLRNEDDYLSPLPHPDGQSLEQALAYLMAHYIDVPPGLDFSAHVDQTGIEFGDGLFLNQGDKWRDQMDVFADKGAIYYIDANNRLHLHTYERATCPWVFTDHFPGGSRTGRVPFREATITEDGSQIVTDALVWGGSPLPGTASEDPDTPSGTVFARYPDPPANTETIGTRWPTTFTAEEEQRAIDRQALYGRWQKAEVRYGQQGYQTLNSVKRQAHLIINGPTGATGADVQAGLNKPLWNISLAWFAHDVPSDRHLKAGEVATFTFYTMGESPSKPLVLSLPTRRIGITFPGLDPLGRSYVRFDGEFGLSYSDSRYLWRYLIRRRRQVANSLTSSDMSTTSLVTTVTPETLAEGTGTNVGDYAWGLSPNEATDGARVLFHLPVPYIAGTTELFLNGLLQRPKIEYTESDPSSGGITFAVAPYADDRFVVNCRTGMS